jgi:outer membrane protein TolC
MRRVIGALLVVLAGGAVGGEFGGAVEGWAQERAPRKVGFDEAVWEAMARNPSVARAATAIGRAEAILSQARAVTRPTVTARVNSITVNTPVAFDDDVIQPRHQVTFAPTLSVPILAPARWAATAQAQDQTAVAADAADEVRTQIAVATAQTYLAIVSAQRQVSVEERSLQTARAHLANAERRLDAGAGSRLDMLRAAQEATAGEARLETVRFELRSAQEALGVLLAENGPVDAAGEPTFVVPLTLDESAWMTARPDFKTQGTIIRAAERVVRDSWKDVGPSATLSFDPQYVVPAGIFQPSRSWRFTASLVQPIFQSGLERAVRKQRQMSLLDQRLALTQLQIQARSEVRLARQAVASRQRALLIVRQSAAQAEEVLQITTAAYELGATTNIEVIDAQRSARDAETSAALAQDGLEQTRLNLLVAIGRFPTRDP